MEPQNTRNTLTDSSGAVLVELKMAEALDEIHRAQRLNYLRASGLHLCLPLDSGKSRLEIKRIVLAL